MGDPARPGPQFLATRSAGEGEGGWFPAPQPLIVWLGATSLGDAVRILGVRTKQGVFGPEGSLLHSRKAWFRPVGRAVSRNGRGSQDRRPRVMTLVCQSPPYVGRGGKLACPRTTAPVFSQTDHQRDRRAPPRGARRATSAA
eukprot:scaffold55618_cov48-Phaeocystis_antarctica.AAC.1